MRTKLEQVLKRLRHPQNQALVGGGLVLGLLMLAMLAGRLGESEGEIYEVLLSDPGDPVEMLRLAKLLSEKGIPHRLEDGGQRLSVCQSRGPEARDLLLASGLHVEAKSSSGSGFFGFSSSFDLSPGAFRQRRVRQKEAELARTISLYPDIRFARVHLNLPERRGFGRRPEAPSASVFLGLRGTRALTPSRAITLRTLVSHAVKGLTPEAVLLADSLGTDYEERIREYGRNTARHRVESQFSLLQEAEERTEAKLLAQLFPLYGEDGVTASVSIAFCQGADSLGHSALIQLEASQESHLCLSNLAICVDRRVVDGQSVAKVKREILELVRNTLGMGHRVRVPLSLRVIPFARSDRIRAPEHEPPPPPGVPHHRAPPGMASSAGLPLPPPPGPGHEVAGGVFGLPLAIFLLMTGALYTARGGAREEPLGQATCASMLPEADQLREDPTARRALVACLSEEDPAFAARVVAHLLRDLDDSGFAHEPAGSFLAGLGVRVAPEVLSLLPDGEVLEALASVARVESDPGLEYLDPGLKVVSWMVAQRALSREGLQEARRLSCDLLGPFRDEDVLEEVDQLWEEPLRGPEEQGKSRERLADQLFQSLGEAPDNGVALALAIAPRPLARRTLVEFVGSGREDAALWLAWLECSFPQVLGRPEVGEELLSELLDGLRVEVRSEVLDRIRNRDPELWTRLFDRGFSIRELEELGEQDLGLLLSRVPANDLALVLREAPEALRRRCLRSLEPATRSFVGQGLDSKAQLSLRDLERARERLGGVCRELGLRGEPHADV